MSVLDIIPAGRDKVRIEGELYREPLGRKTEGTSQAVRERLAREFAERIRANLSRASGPTFDDIAVFFIEERLPELRPHGAERYKLSIKTMTPHFSGKAIGDIDTKALRAFETARRAQGCASGTIRRDLACAFAAIEFYAAVHEIEMENPPGRYLKRRANDKALVEAPPRTRYLTMPRKTGCWRPLRRAWRRTSGCAGWPSPSPSPSRPECASTSSSPCAGPTSTWRASARP